MWNFCAKRGIKNIASIQKENQSLKCELKIAKTEAYNKFADKLINLFEEKVASIEEEYPGNMYTNQSVKTMKFVIQDIKDTLKELKEKYDIFFMSNNVDSVHPIMIRNNICYIGHEDDGTIYFDRKCGHLNNGF